MKETVRLKATIAQAHRFEGWEGVVKGRIEPLKPVELTAAPSGLYIESVFDYYPTDIEEVRSNLKQHYIDTSISVRRTYTRKEILGAEMLSLGAGDNVASVPGTLVPACSPSCPYCGFSELGWDFSRLQIRGRSELPRFATVNWWPYVVSAPLAERIREAGFSGVSLIPVGAGHSHDWYALTVHHVLRPLMAPPTRLRRLPLATPSCAFDHQWKHPDSELFFSQTGMRFLDFNLTYEMFGDSCSSARQLIVTNRVHRLLVELGVKKMEAEPIRILP